MERPVLTADFTANRTIFGQINDICRFPFLRPPTSKVYPETSKSDTSDVVTKCETRVQARKMHSRILPILGSCSAKAYAIFVLFNYIFSIFSNSLIPFALVRKTLIIPAFSRYAIYCGRVFRRIFKSRSKLV